MRDYTAKNRRVDGRADGRKEEGQIVDNQKDLPSNQQEEECESYEGKSGPVGSGEATERPTKLGNEWIEGTEKKVG